MFGGRVAEEMIFGKENVTTGASNDIMQATGLARRMVTEFGFSEKLGPLRYSENQEEVFLGHSVTQQKNNSDATAEIIDLEVRRIVEEGEATARSVLAEFKDQLESLAKALLEYETLSGDEVDSILKGDGINRPTIDDPPSDPKGRSSVPSAGRRKSNEDSGASDLEPEPQGT